MGRSDAELLEASRRGERDAFAALIERYQGVVAAVSYSRTGDRALSEDVAQDTFIAAWRQLGQLREPSRLRSWLCGIARNLARKARRRTAREAPLDQPLVFEGANPFDAAAEAESERVVREALMRVPDTYRDALVLYYRDQRSVRDVAVALGITEAAALQRLARGRQYLADGVTDLVERSLRVAHAPRNLAVIVLAALPAFAPSRAEAASHPHGGTMIKLALVAAVLATAGTTAYVVHRPAATTSTAAVAAPAAPAAAAPAAIPGAPATAAKPTAAPPPGPDRPALADHPGEGPPDLPRVDPATIARLGLARGPARGPADAPVTITVFTDMTCVHCGNALGSLDQLWDEYPGKLRVVVKVFPVRGAVAELPAEAALAADAQGKFWELHDLMLAHQDNLSRPVLLSLAEQAGLDVAAFTAALDSHSLAGQVDANTATAADLGITGTPAFIINGQRVIGNWGIQHFRAMIDQALAEH
ncbi:MAG TPA: sigma-70 family RNA polymerase sigma factor [Kofleriaceae bacterium]|jgi:RNA polymerase sigma factor (sigma-70 family)|nr:sigma-70 family RNA polymerase sigma factor [Kofleriaceae bacterium]